jgi:Protein of unknown function, DUF547
MTAWLRRLVVAALLVSAAGCSTIVSAPAAPALPGEPALASWARVLERFVNDRGEVDFAALAQARGDLDRYVRHVADTPLSSLPAGSERLAHMINAYNALSMFNVLDSGVPASHAGFAKVRFFVLRKMTIGMQTMSLYDFENDVIRPFARSLGEPRVHFALNCSALSCPVLPRQPFTAAALGAELEGETRAFFARSDNYRADDAAATVWISELLSFYAEDFVPCCARSLLEYANRYVATPAPSTYATRFTPYDWTIANSRRTPAPSTR